MQVLQVLQGIEEKTKVWFYQEKSESKEQGRKKGDDKNTAECRQQHFDIGLNFI